MSDTLFHAVDLAVEEYDRSVRDLRDDLQSTKHQLLSSMAENANLHHQINRIKEFHQQRETQHSAIVRGLELELRNVRHELKVFQLQKEQESVQSLTLETENESIKVSEKSVEQFVLHRLTQAVTQEDKFEILIEAFQKEVKKNANLTKKLSQKEEYVLKLEQEMFTLRSKTRSLHEQVLQTTTAIPEIGPGVPTNNNNNTPAKGNGFVPPKPSRGLTPRKDINSIVHLDLKENPPPTVYNFNPSWSYGPLQFFENMTRVTVTESLPTVRQNAAAHGSHGTNKGKFVVDFEITPAAGVAVGGIMIGFASSGYHVGRTGPCFFLRGDGNVTDESASLKPYTRPVVYCGTTTHVRSIIDFDVGEVSWCVNWAQMGPAFRFEGFWRLPSLLYPVVVLKNCGDSAKIKYTSYSPPVQV